jgi:hypothetical protein
MNLIKILGILIGLGSCAHSESKKFGYRLGDMVKLQTARDGKDGRELHYRDFPDSIASEYMRRTNESNRFDLVLEIVEKRTKDTASQVPPKDMLVIHLRIGDVIDKTPYMVKDFLSRSIKYENGVNYVKPLSYYEKILTKAKEFNIHSITLLGGFHAPLKSTKKSLEYVRQIREFFEEHGLNVIERIDLDADEDFIYMCNSEYYAPSGGGYSALIKEILKLKGKHILTAD